MIKVFLICLAFTSSSLGFMPNEERNFSSLCNLYRQKARAMVYGDYSGAKSLEKRIESYKMRFGIESFDERQCEIPQWEYYWIAPPHFRHFPHLH